MISSCVGCFILAYQYICLIHPKAVSNTSPFWMIHKTYWFLFVEWSNRKKWLSKVTCFDDPFDSLFLMIRKVHLNTFAPIIKYYKLSDCSDIHQSRICHMSDLFVKSLQKNHYQPKEMLNFYGWTKSLLPHYISLHIWTNDMSAWNYRDKCHRIMLW